MIQQRQKSLLIFNVPVGSAECGLYPSLQDATRSVSEGDTRKGFWIKGLLILDSIPVNEIVKLLAGEGFPTLFPCL